MGLLQLSDLRLQGSSLFVDGRETGRRTLLQKSDEFSRHARFGRDSGGFVGAGSHSAADVSRGLPDRGVV
ncbi:hypothetical protein [Streptomyces sp. NPDC096132]|uniref:hypothetical protein n=1 Tax=Streptomyces sp. NPDC096132 TaxID=3366075 RepID=UPI0038160517